MLATAPAPPPAAAQGARATLQVGATVLNRCWARAAMASAVGLRCFIPAAIAVGGTSSPRAVRLGRVEREFRPDGPLRLTVLF